VLDVAHNAEGMQQVLRQLAQFYAGQSVHFVIGMVKDKDVTKVLSIMPQQAHYYFTQAQIPRAMPAAELQERAQRFSLTGSTFSHVNEAIAAAKKAAEPNDIIVVCGSVFLVGEVNGL
jgi:dihydrofolate synthase/folylpolyglutamate synthase